MNDIWIVTTGDYSSYQVQAAFSTKEDADAWASISNENEPMYGGDRYQVERIDLDPPLPAQRVFKPEPEPQPDPALPTEQDRIELIDTLILRGRA